MALKRADGTVIADVAGFTALTTPATDDPPVTLNEAVYEDISYGTTAQPSVGATDTASAVTGTRLKYPAGTELRTSEIAALFA